MNDDETSIERCKKAHEHSINNRDELMNSKVCGCFFCEEIFEPSEIEVWIEDTSGTAMCPYCCVDSVIGDKSGFPITKEFLHMMYMKWF